jgi:hypothetical protein
MRFRRLAAVASTCYIVLFGMLSAPSVVPCQLVQTGAAPDVQQEDASRNSEPQMSAEQSCRAFTQTFYDWYWNQFADKADDPKFDRRLLHGYDDALQRKPPLLSPELIRLIKRDDARAKAAGGIANLDFDPYLNSQDPQGKYEVVQVTVIGDLCRAKLSQRDIVAEARRSGPGWVFSNFYYSFYSEDRRKKVAPDDNLVHILSQP